MPRPAAPPRLRVLLELAWPVVLARSTQAVIGFCDALMIRPFGQQALAATTIGAVDVLSVVILPMGTASILQSFASQLSGAGDLVAARRYGWYGFILAAAAAAVAAAGLPLVGPVLGLLDYEPEVRRLMTEYIVIRLSGVAAIVGSEALGNWFGGHGNTRLQMISGAVAMLVNVGLNWVFIYGHLGAPRMGVAGAALASSIASYAGLVVLLAPFLRGRGVPRPAAPPAPGSRRLRGAELGRVFRFGLPGGLNWFLEFAAFLLFVNVVMADLGTAVVAAFMVVININAVSFMPAFGVSSAGAILVGQAIGAGRPDDVPGIVRQTALTAAAWQGAVGLVYLLFPAVLMSWFATPGDVTGAGLVAIGTTLLAISSAWQLFDSLGMAVGEALRAAGDTAWCMFARLAVAWLVFTPVALVTVRGLGGGHIAAILCMVGYLAILAALFLWRFRTGRWREIDLTGSRGHALPHA
jgi:MATE family multidrug resistance protein